MPRTLAALIRHGDYCQLPRTPSAHQPFALNPEGEEQAKTAVETIRAILAENHWQLSTTVHSSTLLRAWQTAKIIGDGLKQAFPSPYRIEQSGALTERCVGSAANLSIDQIEEIIAKDPRFDPLPANWKSNSHFCLPLEGAESLMDAGVRVANYLESALCELAKGDAADSIALFVGHGASFRHAAYKLGILEFGDIAKLSMYHAVPVVVERMHDGSWHHVTGDWKIRKKNTSYTD